MSSSLSKKVGSFVVVLIQLLGLWSGGFFFARPVVAAPAADPALVEQTVLIQFAATASVADRDAMIAQINGQLLRWLPQIHVAEVRLTATDTSDQALIKGDAAALAQRRWQSLGRNALITHIENDVVVEGTYLPNDPDVANQPRTYTLQAIHALEAWDYTRGDPSVIIAVLDSGINAAHPEFQDRVLAGYDFINDDDTPGDDHGHGTHTAGIIAAGIDNGLGMVGICPECTLLPVKVLNQNNAGTWVGVAAGILYATDQGARVINLSLGASVSSKTLESAVAYAIAHDVLIVAAAGNMGVDRKFYPAALDGVMAVSATDENNQRWSLSNMGDYIDVAAPGHAVYSTYNDLGNYYGGYNYMSGTSMAAPHVAGLAGLLLSQKLDRNAAEVYHIIVSTTDKPTNPNEVVYFGYGRINVARAVAVVQDNQWIPAPLVDKADGASDQLLQHAYLPLVTNP